MIRVILPAHLQTLAGTGNEVHLHVPGRVTLSAVLDALEERFPVLGGAIRDHETKKRRALLRYFACGQDLSHDPPGELLPAAVESGAEPLIILGAIAGG